MCRQTVVELDVNGSAPYYQVYRSCVEKCTLLHFTDTVLPVNSKVETECCETNDCNNRTIILPPKDNTTNGKACETCYEQNVTDCQKAVKLPCTGKETGCIEFRGMVDLGQGKTAYTVAKGCSNLESCDPRPDFPRELVPEAQKITCTKAPPSE